MSSPAASAVTKKRKRTETGAPAQKTQSTRKGKRAWRKNVDLQDIEAGIESLREEEIVTGYAILTMAGVPLNHGIGSQ